jgi:hypothetical protein
VVKWFPELRNNNTSLFLWVWFMTSNIIYTIDFLKVARICGEKFIMVTFTAFLQINIDDVEFFYKRKVKLLKENVMIAGHSPHMLTREKTQKRKEEQINHPSTFTTGFVYSHYHIIEYDPSKVMNKNEFIPAQTVKYIDTGLYDCLTLSIN